jgi:hypothetical protein
MPFVIGFSVSYSNCSNLFLFLSFISWTRFPAPYRADLLRLVHVEKAESVDSISTDSRSKLTGAPGLTPALAKSHPRCFGG